MSDRAKAVLASMFENMALSFEDLIGPDEEEEEIYADDEEAQRVEREEAARALADQRKAEKAEDRKQRADTAKSFEKQFKAVVAGLAGIVEAVSRMQAVLESDAKASAAAITALRSDFVRLEAAMKAPKELVKDKDGKPIGVRIKA